MGKAKQYARTAISAFFDPEEKLGLDRPTKPKRKKPQKTKSKTTTAGKLKLRGRHK